MFARALRLTRARDVQRVYKLGKSAASQFLLVRILPNRLNHPRLTVITSKKVAKKAVLRNRIKRLVRQALSELLREPNIAKQLQNADCIITIHRDPQPPYTLDKVKAEVSQCFARLPSA